MPIKKLATKLRETMAEQSPIDLEEHAARIARVVAHKLGFRDQEGQEAEPQEVPEGVGAQTGDVLQDMRDDPPEVRGER